MNAYICMQTHSTCYQKTGTMKPVGILWHSTGCNNPNIKRYVQPYEGDANYAEAIAKLGVNTAHNDWNHIYHEAGLNAWIGKFADGSVGVCQTMPWEYKPWGCGAAYKGGPSCNAGWIQFEICEDALNDPAYAQKTWDTAIELSVYLCKLYGLDPTGTATCGGKQVPVITCHNDAAKLGCAGNHADINHWFPKLLGKNMENARQEIKAKLAEGTKEPQEATQNAEVAQTPTETLKPAVQTSEQAIWDYLMAHTGNAYASAGIMGNLYAESGLRTNNLQNSYEGKLGMTDEQYTAAVDNGSYTNFVHDSAGYGVAQWTYWSRKEGLLALAKAAKRSIADAEVQFSYLIEEMTGSGLLKQLKTAPTVRIASDLVLTQYEKPADQSEAVKQKRAEYSQNYFNKYAQTQKIYRVQTGAFKNRSNAQKLADQLEAKGFDTIIKQAGDIYRVQVGAYANPENAKAMQKKLQQAGYTDAFITEA